VRKIDFGSWHYTAYRGIRNSLDVTIQYDFESVNGIRAYAEANKKLTEQLASGGGQVEVYVTFRNYVSPEQFRAWVKATGLTSGPTTQVYGIVRMVQQDGTRITAYTGPDAQTDKVQARWADVGAKVQGIVAARGWMATSQLLSLQKDQLVFLVDVTPNVVRNDLNANGVNGVDQARVMVIPETPFWTMEDVGLDNFRQ